MNLIDYDLRRIQDEDAKGDAPGLSATIISRNGNPIEHLPNFLLVAYLKLNSPYLMLQGYIEEDDTSFDEMFYPDINNGNFGFHQGYFPQAALYVVPMEACGATKPVRAIAALCLGTEAIDYFEDRPDESQIFPLFTAAQIALEGKK